MVDVYGKYRTLDSSVLPVGFFDLISQKAVRTSRFDAGKAYNAIWDFADGCNGKYYAALCGEGLGSVSAQLYEYDPGTGSLDLCFDTGRETMVGDRQTPPSKIHTSIQAMGDGRLIMTTHTTSPAPQHKFWLFEQSYYHHWEGFPGSHVLVYDTAKREVKTLGIPVLRDTIYGAVYDARYDALWFTTFLKGHLFRLDMKTRRVRDFGQITEFGSHCLFKDRLGNLYTSSRSGHLFHIDVGTCRITDLGGIANEPESNGLWNHHRVIAHSHIGPDGRNYLGLHFSDYMFAVDPESRKIERVGTFIPDSHHKALPSVLAGVAFDGNGCMWVSCMYPFAWGVGNLVYLVRWDVTRGGKPQNMGLLGTPDRIVAITSKIIADKKNNVLHFADTNHASDLPQILSVNLAELKPLGSECRETAKDVHAYLLFKDAPNLYPGDHFHDLADHYYQLEDHYQEQGRFYAEQASTSISAKSSSALRLWEHMPWGQSSVHALRWEADGVLTAWCGIEGQHRVRISEKRIEGIQSDTKDCPHALPMPSELANAKLPARQGRKFAAKASCWSKWQENQWLIGTQDGLLAKYDPTTNQTIALGTVGAHGPIHQIVVDPIGRQAYGVSGDPSDLGHVFHYDDATGLREIGRTVLQLEKKIIYSSSQPCCLALSGDGKTLAIGVRDQLGTVYLYQEPTV